MDGAVAYASASENNPLTAGSYRTMTIYPDDSRCDQIFVMLRTDDTTAKRIISSARLAEEGDSTL